MASELGPLSGLEGIWEGDRGTDTSPDPAITGSAVSAYRERMTFDATGLVANHAQTLRWLRYATTAWRIGEADPFHEEVGYWLWDAAEKQLMRCFTIPRGVSVIAGGRVEPSAGSFELSAELGAQTYGICSNPFLDREMRTIRFELRFEKQGADTIHYWQNTVLQIAGQGAPFGHTDENTLTRVG